MNLKTSPIAPACAFALAGAALLAPYSSALAQTGTPPDPSQARPATAATTGDQKLTSDERTFVKEAIEGNIKEVTLGTLAKEKASDKGVKDFGAMMVSDHSKANEKLISLAKSKGVEVPTVPGSKTKSTMNSLEKLEGKSFDKEYVKNMLEDHRKDVAKYQKISQSAKDAEVKSYASATLPTLQKHLKQVEDLAEKHK